MKETCTTTGRKRRAWLCAAAVIAGAIFYCSLFQKPPTNGVKNLDKVFHFGAYALLALSLCAWLTGGRRARGAFVMILGVVLAALYGASLEVAQHLFAAGRTFDLFDVAANVAGGVTGVAAWAALSRMTRFL